MRYQKYLPLQNQSVIKTQGERPNYPLVLRRVLSTRKGARLRLLLFGFVVRLSNNSRFLLHKKAYIKHGDKKMKNNKGFTLIELLVVVLIIGILAAIALPQYFRAVERSRAAEANSVLGAINHAQAVYHMAHSDPDTAYTQDFGALDTEFIDASRSAATGSSFDSDLFTYELIDVSQSTAHACATRLDDIGYKLGIDYATGARCCKDGDTDKNGANICASMGITSTDGCCTTTTDPNP